MGHFPLMDRASILAKGHEMKWGRETLRLFVEKKCVMTEEYETLRAISKWPRYYSDLTPDQWPEELRQTDSGVTRCATQTDDQVRIVALASGSIQPSDGYEKHFLRVLAGEALVCSQKEQTWLDIWLSTESSRKPVTTAAATNEVATLQGRLAAADQKVLNQQNLIDALRDDLADAKKALDDSAREREGLCARIDQLNSFLAECHKTIAKYERPPKVLVTDFSDPLKSARRAKSSGFVVYSSTDGQD